MVKSREVTRVIGPQGSKGQVQGSQEGTMDLEGMNKSQDLSISAGKPGKDQFLQH